MKSKLHINEFRKKLEENIAIGNPEIKIIGFGIFTIFNGFSKRFYGKFDKSTFQITSNSTMFPTSYIIKGTYKSNNQDLIINYAVEPFSKFQGIYFKIFPIISMSLINLVLFNERENISTRSFIVVNIFGILFNVFGIWLVNKKKKRLEKKFVEIFEIE